MDVTHNIDSRRNVPFKQAISALGGQTKMAKLKGCTQGAVSKRLNSGKPIWGDDGLVLKVEAATGISRHDLRPDIYPREQPPSSGTRPEDTSPAVAPAAGDVAADHESVPS
mgnify:CR=1 FL=1